MDCPLCQKLNQVYRVGQDVVWQFTHSVAFLGPWQYYTGYCILVSRRHATELNHLSEEERHGYLDEMCRLARAMETCFQPHKLNYELLGNQVPHLHWHLFPRQLDDPELLRPVWFALDRADNDPKEKQRLETGSKTRLQVIAALRETLKNQGERKAN